jgi:hypothetical protein
MLKIAIVSWILGGLVGLIAAAAANAVVVGVRRSEGLAMTREGQKQAEVDRLWVRGMMLAFAGWTYGLVFYFWTFYQPCGAMQSESSCGAGPGQWPLGLEFLFLLALGLLLGNGILARLFGKTARPAHPGPPH